MDTYRSIHAHKVNWAGLRLLCLTTLLCCTFERDDTSVERSVQRDARVHAPKVEAAPRPTGFLLHEISPTPPMEGPLTCVAAHLGMREWEKSLVAYLWTKSITHGLVGCHIFNFQHSVLWNGLEVTTQCDGWWQLLKAQYESRKEMNIKASEIRVKSTHQEALKSISRGWARLPWLPSVTPARLC